MTLVYLFIHINATFCRSLDEKNKEVTKSDSTPSNIHDDGINVEFVFNEVDNISQSSPPEMDARISTCTMESGGICSPEMDSSVVADICSVAEMNEQEAGDQIMNSKPELVCKTCSKQFTSRKSLIQHMKLKHLESLPHGCQICGKRFHLLQNLNSHLKSHGSLSEDSTKNDVCKTCGLQFTKRKSLVQHMKYKHKETVPYGCQICCKSFYLRKNLRLHLKTHGLLPEDSTNSELGSIPELEIGKKGP